MMLASMRGRRTSSRRGAAFIGVTLALLAVLVAAATSTMLITAVRAKQSLYERNVIQALYAAEAGVETALQAVRDGEDVPESIEGRCGQATWQVQISRTRAGVELVSTGKVQPAVGQPSYRRIQVRARRAGEDYRLVSWQRVPFQPPETPPDDATGQFGESGERR